MITTSGRSALRRFVAGYRKNYITSIAVGVGETAASAGDTRLAHEVMRVPVTAIGLDELNSTVTYKATLPSYLVGNFYEIGAFSDGVQDASNPALGTLFTVDATELWTWGVGADEYDATQARVGTRTIRLSPAASQTEYATLPVSKDLSKMASNDLFNVAYQATANLASVIVRLKTSSTDYYTLTFNNSGTGYKTATVAKSAATTTGSPLWSNIKEIEVRATASAGGATNVYIDSLRVDQAGPFNNGDILCDRVTTTVKAKIAGRTQDVEFSIPINFT